jgi:hypothetical protein
MRKALFILLSMCTLFLGLSVGFAAEPAQLNAVTLNIPFDFHVGDRLLPAGNYVVEMPAMSGYSTGSMLRIASEDREICQHQLTMRVSGVTYDNDFHVKFTKYGKSYFLSSVKNSFAGAELIKSKTEKRIAADMADVAAASITSVELTASSKAK